MKKKSILYSAAILTFSLSAALFYFRQPDITIIGPIKSGDGLGRNTVDFIKVLSSQNNLNCIPTYYSGKGLDKEVKSKIFNPNKRLGKIILFTKPLWTPHDRNTKLMRKLKNASNSFKVAYTMFESSCIPPEWALMLNEYFDLAVVPDKYLVNVYKRSGVTIPIKVLPLCMDMSAIKNQPIKTKKNEIFTFSILSSGIYRKNIMTVIKAFSRLFADDENVVLRINCRYGLDKTVDSIKDYIKKHKITNIFFSKSNLSSSSYVSLLQNTDCLINVSLGEGFSIQPREAMALGIPCILSNNTAQTEICNTGLVADVNCTRKEAAFHFFSDLPYGEFFLCEEDDVAEKMWDVFSNFESYSQNSLKMREWALKYDLSSMKEEYNRFFSLHNLSQIKERQ